MHVCAILARFYARYDHRNARTREIRAPTRDIRTHRRAHIHVHDEEDNDESSCPRLCAASLDTVRERTGCTVRARCTRTRAGARGRTTRENTIKAAPGKNTNLNGTKEICSHIRCIRMNGARLLQFTIYCFATFFSADASGIRSLLPVPYRPPRSSHRRPFRRSRSFLLSFSLPLSFGTGYMAESEMEESERVE